MLLKVGEIESYGLVKADYTGYITQILYLIMGHESKQIQLIHHESHLYHPGSDSAAGHDLL